MTTSEPKKPASWTDAEDSLREVERVNRQWEAAVDALPGLIAVVNTEGEVIRGNQALEKRTGRLASEIVGKNLHGLLHPDCDGGCEFVTVYDSLSAKAAAGRPAFGEIYDPILNKHLEIRARAVMEDGQAQAIAFVMNDVSTSFRLERDLRDHSDRLEVLNVISKSILSLENEEEIGRLVLRYGRTVVPFDLGLIVVHETAGDKPQILEIMGQADFPREKLFAADVPALSQLRQSFLITDMSQAVFMQEVLEDWLGIKIGTLLNIPLSLDRRIIGQIFLTATSPAAFTSVHHHITREIAELLTIGLRQVWLRRRLERSNEELQGLLRANHEQLQNVTHELRSPLALIKGYTEMLRDGVMGPLTERQEETLAILDTKGDQLLFMIQRLFTLQTIDANQVQYARVTPYPFLADIVRSWEVFAANKEIQIKLDVPADLPSFEGDPDLITQVLSNLLDNAMKFSEAGDKITIEAREAGEEIIISVRDEGVGMAAEIQEQIFLRFYQDRSSSRARLGAGIGLSLCKAIVTAHSGRIWVESEGPGRGSTFSFALPRRIS